MTTERERRKAQMTAAATRRTEPDAAPAGKTAIDPQTHHCSLDVYIAEAQNRTFKVVESWPQQPPADTAAVCNLKKNPNDNQQYVIDVK